MTAADLAPVPTAPAPPRSGVAPLAIATLAGALVALQQRLNGELGTALDDALLAALLSFGTGLVAVLAVVLARPATRRAVGGVRRVPWPFRLGGLGGASVVTAGAFAAPEIGVALLTVALVAGQTTGGLVVDRVGLGPGGSHPLTPPRVLAAVLCLVAVVVGVQGDVARSASPLLLVLVLLAGFTISVQQALDGRVRRETGDAAVATLVNVVVGGTALAVGMLLRALLVGVDVATWPGADRWWLYLGGPLGACFVGLAAMVVRRLGVLRLGLALICGQLVGALLLDLLSPVNDAGVGMLTLAGVGLTLAAVVVSGRGKT